MANPPSHCHGAFALGELARSVLTPLELELPYFLACGCQKGSLKQKSGALALEGLAYTTFCLLELELPHFIFQYKAPNTFHCTSYELCKFDQELHGRFLGAQSQFEAPQFFL